MDNVLIVVAKEPVPGTTKTRLCPPFTPEEAAELYRCLLLDTLELMAQVDSADRAIAFTPAVSRAYFEELAPDGFQLLLQQGADLGERLSHALGYHFNLGYQRAVIMNSDGPTLPVNCLEEAFSALSSADITLGPGHDGGYYLIGMKRLYPELFQGITWSTNRVFAETLEVAHHLGLVAHQLPAWYDVDVGDDLDRLRQDLSSDPALAPCTRAFLANR